MKLNLGTTHEHLKYLRGRWVFAPFTIQVSRICWVFVSEIANACVNRTLMRISECVFVLTFLPTHK